MTITDEQLAEWEALAAESFPGPWRCTGVQFVSGTRSVNGRNEDVEVADVDCLLSVPDIDGHTVDATEAFIAQARTAVPALIAEVWRLRKELRETEMQLDNALEESLHPHD